MSQDPCFKVSVLAVTQAKAHIPTAAYVNRDIWQQAQD